MSTGLVLRETGSSFAPAPDGGHSAACVDVVDLGIVRSTWEGEERSTHKCRIVFCIAETMEDGRQFTVGRQFTASLHEKAGLRKFLESWRGRPFTKEELTGFDTEQLIGAPAVIQVVHTPRAGKVYANIDSVMKLMKGVARVAPDGKYVRVKDRAPQNGTGHDGPPDDGAPPPDEPEDDLPF
jgi:hypothetical protein